MKLHELAFACYIYSNMTDYDESYVSFLKLTDNQPNLAIPNHLEALLIWLNDWRCRQFAKEFHSLAASEIAMWYKQYNPILFDQNKKLSELTEVEMKVIPQAYDALAEKIASNRDRNGKTIRVSVGATGASKILFAIRKNVFVPWDDPIRRHHKYDGSGESYLQYLCSIKEILSELEKECSMNNLTLTQLPMVLGRSNSTVIKLIDEYNWVTITNELPFPEDAMFDQWVEWRSKRNERNGGTSNF